MNPGWPCHRCIHHPAYSMTILTPSCVKDTKPVFEDGDWRCNEGRPLKGYDPILKRAAAMAAERSKE